MLKKTTICITSFASVHSLEQLVKLVEQVETCVEWAFSP